MLPLVIVHKMPVINAVAVLVLPGPRTVQLWVVPGGMTVTPNPLPKE